MQCYVKSAGKSYDQDYTWIQLSGNESDYTCLFSQMVRDLSMRVPSMALFCQDCKYYLLFGGLKTGRTDFVGTPISNTFAFVCPVEDEQNIRFLVAGLLNSNTKFNQLLLSAVQEDMGNKLGFCASDDFSRKITTWLKDEGVGVLKSLEDNAKIHKLELVSFLQKSLPISEKNILLVNSEKEVNSNFHMFSSDKIVFGLVVLDDFHSESIKHGTAQRKSQKEEGSMDIQNATNEPLNGVGQMDDFRIFLFSAPRGIQSDYYFWKKSDPVWGGGLREKLFSFEMTRTGLCYGIAIELDGDCYHVYLEDGMQKITAIGTGRWINVKLYFELPAQVGGQTKEEVERGLRSICASWTDVDPDYGNKVLREIIERKALIVNDATFEVDEEEMKKILWYFFNQGTGLKNELCQQEVCHIAKDWSGFVEAKRWFGEKLRTTCFSYDNSLLCYFTPCEVVNPKMVSYCARWSRKPETVIQKPEPRNPKPEPPSPKPIYPTPIGPSKKMLYIVVGAVLIVSLIVMMKSCSVHSRQTREEISTNTNNVLKIGQQDFNLKQ